MNICSLVTVVCQVVDLLFKYNVNPGEAGSDSLSPQHDLESNVDYFQHLAKYTLHLSYYYDLH